MGTGGQIDFKNDTHTITVQSDISEVPLSTDLASLDGVYKIDHDSNLPVFLVLRPVFYQKMNDRLYELKGNGYNVASLVFVKKSVEYEMLGG